MKCRFAVPARVRAILVSLLCAILAITCGAGNAASQAADATGSAPGAAPGNSAAAPAPSRVGAGLLAGPVDPETYRLGPGDVLSLELSGRAARQTSLVVDVEGRLNVPEMGIVAVSGRTLAAARAQILARLARAYPGARVDLRLVDVRTFKVYVAGQVAAAGVASANAMTRASEVFRGDFALREDASRRNIELRRRDGARIRVDLDGFALLGRGDDDPYLEDGDVLFVPPRRERVFALGAFARPGEYELAPGDSVAALVDLAGGLLPSARIESAMLSRFVTPGRVDSFPVDLGAVLARWGGPELQHQDRLFVQSEGDYRRVRSATLVGEVARPGPYPIRDGEDRLAAVLARAGGLAPGAARERIQVLRRGPAGAPRDIEFERLSRLNRSEMSDAEYTQFKTKLASQQAAFVVSYEQLVAPGSAFDVLLEDGDVVVIDRETRSVRVAGEVKSPALVEFAPGRSAAQYIALAGGFSKRARRGEVRVTRAGSNQTLLVDDLREIQPGDFIWVPEKKDVNFWGVFKDVLLVAGSVATVIVVVRDNTR